MGGSGSGNWYRWNTKTTTNDVKRLDVRLMQRNGWLTPNRQGKLNWTRNDEPWGDIDYRCYSDRLELNYRYRENGSEWESVSQRINLDKTSCHYGGGRPWFLCTRCNGRCALLYCDGKYFFCRKCYQLPYRSQNQSRINRLIDQKHKLGYRIFAEYDGCGWGKRKGMHHSIFNRLYKKYCAIDSEIDQMIGSYY